MAGAGCRASPSERATSRVVTRGAPRRRPPCRRHAACFVSKQLCSVLERLPLFHPTASLALGRASPPAATDGKGVALKAGIGGTLWESRRVGPVMKVVDRRQQVVLMVYVFDEVLQPSHIARAWIAGEGVQRLGGDGIDAFAPMLRIGVCEEVCMKWRTNGGLSAVCSRKEGTMMGNTCSR